MGLDVPPKGFSRELAISAIRIAVVGVLVYWSFIIIRPFLTTIIWSAIIAVALYPVFAWTAAKLGGRRVLAAATIVVISLIVIMGPATWLGVILAENVRSLLERFGEGAIAIPQPSDAVKAWPLIGSQIYETWYRASTDFKEVFLEAAPQLKSLGTRLLAIAGDSGVNLIKFVVAVIASGFLLVSGPAIMASARKILREVVTARGEEFIDLTGATIRNVSRGIIGIAVLQALLAGIGLMTAGFPAAGLLSFLVLLFGVLQFPALVLIPIIVASWFMMEPTPAVLFSVYMAAVSALDNVLRPLVMARGLSVPMLVILVGVLGGILAHGIIGLFVGPVVLSIVWQLLINWLKPPTDEDAKSASGAAQ
jgi:predicted PurR-regulated permease PerM